MDKGITVNDANIGVYRIVAPSGKMYVGMTCISFKSRWDGHHKDFRSKKHKCKGLLYSAQKYGFENLSFEIVEEWEKPEDEDELISLKDLILEREKYWWNFYKDQGIVLYNGEPTGTGSVFHTELSKNNLLKTIAKNNAHLKIDIPFSAEEISEIEALYKKGLSKMQILKTLNICPARAKKQKSVFLKFSLANQKALTERRIAKSKENTQKLREEGLTTKQISEKLKVSITTVLTYSPVLEKDSNAFQSETGPYCSDEISLNIISRHIQYSHSGAPSWIELTKVNIPFSERETMLTENLYRMGFPVEEISNILNIRMFRLQNNFSQKDFLRILDLEMKEKLAVVATEIMSTGKPQYKVAEELGLSRGLLRNILLKEALLQELTSSSGS